MLRLRELRAARKINQQTLAEHLGVTQATLSGWETGKYDIDNQSLAECADYFGVTTDYILGRTDKKSPAPGEAQDGEKKNLIRIIGRDGSYEERYLTDEQLQAMKAVVKQMPKVEDDF